MRIGLIGAGHIGGNCARQAIKGGHEVMLSFAILSGDVDDIEVHPGPGDLAGQVGQHARAVLDINHDHLALSRDREMRNRKRMLRGLGVRDEDVELGSLA